MAKQRRTPVLVRCPWAKGDEYIEYHDREGGVPVHDDRRRSACLIRDGAQAGRSRANIRKKGDNDRKASDGL